MKVRRRELGEKTQGKLLWLWAEEWLTPAILTIPQFHLHEHAVDA
jgi:hypothetical protein